MQRRRRMTYGLKADENTVLLIHFDREIKDSSKNEILIWDKYTEFVDGKFGYAADMYNARRPYASISSRLSTEFTAECFLKGYFTNSDWGGIFTTFVHRRADDSGFSLRCHSENYGFNAYVKNTNGVETDTGWLGSLGVNAVEWTHIAITYNGSNIRFFSNGALIISIAASGIINPSAIHFGKWSYDTAGPYQNMYIDEFRLSNIARYTGSFTPPTKPFR